MWPDRHIKQNPFLLSQPSFPDFPQRLAKRRQRDIVCVCVRVCVCVCVCVCEVNILLTFTPAGHSFLHRRPATKAMARQARGPAPDHLMYLLPKIDTRPPPKSRADRNKVRFFCKQNKFDESKPCLVDMKYSFKAFPFRRQRTVSLGHCF